MVRPCVVNYFILIEEYIMANVWLINFQYGCNEVWKKLGGNFFLREH